MRIILGSSSVGRRSVLEGAGYTFDVVPPEIDEKAVRAADPRETPLYVARAKADALARAITDPAIVIAGDQVVFCDGVMEEKPESPDEARAFWARYAAGHPAETLSAVVVLNTVTGVRAEGTESAFVHFKPIAADVLEAYIASGDALRQSGGFAIEDALIAPYIERIEGTPDSVRGLPLALVERLMAQVRG